MGRTRAQRGPDVRAVSRKLQRLLASEREPITGATKDPVQAADVAGLRYVSDDSPGIRRVGSAKSARYLRADGGVVKDDATLARIRALAIPPAWTQVWICPDANGHIQASGRDDKGRKQYRYHGRWREVRDRTKFGRMIEFALALPRIRRAVERDLALPGLSRDKVLATLVRLLEQTRIRIGNDEYARTNRHFGLTTLQDRHVAVKGPDVRFRFVGKSGKTHEVALHDPRLARIVRGCQEVPGQRLFQFYDESGEAHAVDSGDVNEYLRTVSGSDFTAKDFRTWGGTVCVATRLISCAEPETVKAAKAQVIAAIDEAAECLGNTRSVCRASYVHPVVLDAFMEGWIWAPRGAPAGRAPAGLSREEAATLRLLQAAARPVREVKRSAHRKPPQRTQARVTRRAAA